MVCNFKVNYVLKEGFVAIPFHVNSTNITTALGSGFEFKQGLLFQRFVIAAGSFKSASEYEDNRGSSSKATFTAAIMLESNPKLLLLPFYLHTKVMK